MVHLQFIDVWNTSEPCDWSCNDFSGLEKVSFDKADPQSIYQQVSKDCQSKKLKNFSNQVLLVVPEGPENGIIHDISLDVLGLSDHLHI